VRRPVRVGSREIIAVVTYFVDDVTGQRGRPVKLA